MKNKTSLILILGSVIMLGIIIYYMNFRTVTVEFAAKIGAGVAPKTVKWEKQLLNQLLHKAMNISS